MLICDYAQTATAGSSQYEVPPFLCISHPAQQEAQLYVVSSAHFWHPVDLQPFPEKDWQVGFSIWALQVLSAGGLGAGVGDGDGTGGGVS